MHHAAQRLLGSLWAARNQPGPFARTLEAPKLPCLSLSLHNECSPFGKRHADATAIGRTRKETLAKALHVQSDHLCCAVSANAEGVGNVIWLEENALQAGESSKELTPGVTSDGTGFSGILARLRLTGSN